MTEMDLAAAPLPARIRGTSGWLPGGIIVGLGWFAVPW